MYTKEAVLVASAGAGLPDSAASPTTKLHAAVVNTERRDVIDGSGSCDFSVIVWPEEEGDKNDGAFAFVGGDSDNEDTPLRNVPDDVINARKTRVTADCDRLLSRFMVFDILGFLQYPFESSSLCCKDCRNFELAQVSIKIICLIITSLESESITFPTQFMSRTSSSTGVQKKKVSPEWLVNC